MSNTFEIDIFDVNIFQEYRVGKFNEKSISVI